MAAVDLMIPPACLACKQKLAGTSKHLCPDCVAKVSSSRGNCPKCGGDTEQGVCRHCRDISYSFEFCRSAMEYKDPLPELIHALKYRGMSSLGNFLGKRMAQSALDFTDFAEYSEVVPIPLHPVRLRERGYNQSEIIARSLAKELGKRYLNCLQRNRYTKSQTMLERKERLINLRGAFRVHKPASVLGKNLILVDDVFTTGSTLNEASRALYAAGAAKVAGYTATRA